jgi:hypothetical protein
MILSNSDDAAWWPVRQHIIGHDRRWLVINLPKPYTAPSVGFDLDIEESPGVSIFGRLI